MVKFRVYDPIFHTECCVVVEPNILKIAKYAKKVLSWDKPLGEILQMISGATAITFSNGQSNLVCFSHYDFTTEDISTLVHEINHVADNSLGAMPCPRSDDTREVYSYYQGYMARKITDGLSKRKEAILSLPSPCDVEVPEDEL